MPSSPFAYLASEWQHHGSQTQTRRHPDDGPVSLGRGMIILSRNQWILSGNQWILSDFAVNDFCWLSQVWIHCPPNQRWKFINKVLKKHHLAFVAGWREKYSTLFWVLKVAIGEKIDKCLKPPPIYSIFIQSHSVYLYIIIWYIYICLRNSGKMTNHVRNVFEWSFWPFRVGSEAQIRRKNGKAFLSVENMLKSNQAPNLSIGWHIVGTQETLFFSGKRMEL